jgi:hypothetical protein
VVGALAFGFFKSTDGGGSWRPANTGLTCGLSLCRVTALAINPQTPTTVYAGTSGGGVFKSTNGGGSWSPANTGLPITNVVQVLALDSRSPATLYAGTSGGVFKTTDGGGSWSALNAGLTNLDVQTLAVDSSTPPRVYAGTNGGGVFVLDAATDPGGGGTGGGDGGTCFVATAAYGSPLAPQVAVLRSFRDRYLLPYRSGQAVVGLYARLSPPLAAWLRDHDGVRAVVRGALWPVAGWARLALASPALAFILLGSGGLALALFPCVLHRGWRPRAPRRGPWREP